MRPLLQPQANPAANQRWKILLVSANRCVTPEPVFPLGLAHLGTALRAAGCDVDWLDLLVDENAIEQKLRESKPDLVAISVRNIDDVLIRRQETFVEHLGGLVQMIHHQLGCPVVLGGSGYSILPREMFELTNTDFGIVGEGEVALPALVEALRKGSGLERIPGLVFRREHKVVVNDPDRTLRTAQPAADVPADIARHYLQRGGILNVQTQRGCAHRCCYCTYPVIEGARHRRRDPQEVAEEFVQLERLGARYAFVVDSVFNSSLAHVHQICEALARRKLQIRWGCFLRPQGLDRETTRLMALAGLAHIEFGSDSFCDETLQAYQKDFTFEDIRRSTELARAQDIDFCHFIIAGGPGETLRTLEAGFENSRALAGAIIMAVPGMRIYPGTPLFDRAVAEGRLEPGTNLLKPVYYLAPGLTLEMVFETLKRFALESPNWVVGDSNAAYEKLVARLRQRGVTGPLWSYFATAQRLWPQPPSEING